MTFDQKLRRFSVRILVPGGFMFIGLTFALMIVFRALGIIQTPWAIVLAPLWFPPAFWFSCGFAWFCFLLFLMILVGFGS